MKGGWWNAFPKRMPLIYLKVLSGFYMWMTLTVQCGLVLILSPDDDVTQQEPSDIFFWDGWPPQHHWTQCLVGEADVCRSADRSCWNQTMKTTKSDFFCFMKHLVFKVGHRWTYFLVWNKTVWSHRYPRCCWCVLCCTCPCTALRLESVCNARKAPKVLHFRWRQREILTV